MATSAFQVVTSGMPQRGPDMSSRDMRLVAAPDEATGSEWSETLEWGLCGPFGCCRPTHLATTAAYASPPSVRPSCRLLSAASSLVEPWASRPFPNRWPGAGRRLQGSDGPSELEISSAFLLLTGICGYSWEVKILTPDSALTPEG